MSDVDAMILRTHKERVTINTESGLVHRTPVLSIETEVRSTGLKAIEVSAFCEALRAAGAADDVLVVPVPGKVSSANDRAHLIATWRQIIPSESA